MVNEADTTTTLVRPRVVAAGWDNTPQTFGEQFSFTDGRIVTPGGKPRRLERKVADFVLNFNRDLPLAVVEVKAEDRPAGDGMQQAKEYATILGLKFAYATNGRTVLEFDAYTQQEAERGKSSQRVGDRPAVYGVDAAACDQVIDGPSEEKGKVDHADGWNGDAKRC